MLATVGYEVGDPHLPGCLSWLLLLSNRLAFVSQRRNPQPTPAKALSPVPKMTSCLPLPTQSLDQFMDAVVPDVTADPPPSPRYRTHLQDRTTLRADPVGVLVLCCLYSPSKSIVISK